MSRTPLLDEINLPSDLRNVDKEKLPQLAGELRAELIDALSVTGGHFGAGLGVIELTLALHYVFDTPQDRLIWDVGHQAYPHKILTGRRGRNRTIRKGGGFSGFTRRSQSEFDAFGAARLEIRTLTLPDVFQDYDDPVRQCEAAGLSAARIAQVLRAHLVQASAGAAE